MDSQNKEQPEMSDFDWISLQNDLGAGKQTETTKEKMIRKIKENPMVPIGCLATLGALTYGLWSFKHGRRQVSQYMMRTRVAAQGFTIIALIVGIGIAARKAN